MGNIVILEGPDATGKTTFANFLCEQYQYLYHHEGVPPIGTNLPEYYGSQLLKARYSEHDHVFDRQFLGQLVYGPIHRDAEEIPAAPFIWLVQIWDIKLILFNTDYETQFEIWKKRHHDEHIKSEIVLRKCFDAWNSIADKYPYFPRFDYRKDSYDKLIDIINERRNDGTIL